MKTGTGKIVIGIDQKVYFEPEASKQLIEVSNEIYPVTITFNQKWILLKRDWKVIKGKESCKAKITGGKAEIIEITK